MAMLMGWVQLQFMSSMADLDVPFGTTHHQFRITKC
jgi:hypothetical protein